VYLIYCFYLIFNPADIEKSLGRLKKFLLSTGNSFKILVINNGEELFNVNANSIELIRGDNTFWEFSGWEKARQSLNSTTEFNVHDKFLFVNDTFDRNHSFSWMTSKLYQHKLSSLSKSKGFVLGEMHSKAIDFNIDGYEFRNWISSYFFLLDHKAYLSTSFVSKRLSDAVLDVSDTEIKLDRAIVCDKLTRHINLWLRPKTKGWYLAKSADNLLIRNKCIAILHEKHLSAQLKAHGVRAYNIYDSFVGRAVCKLESIVFKLKNISNR
jgi:hypothetical protein